ncbi:endonuclease/exonuclease/phosphatase family protein [Nocardiopsis akebiae]|nr:endonuclease/exonuclease/phosphatase family protein [Nocardiopsis akebiae]
MDDLHLVTTVGDLLTQPSGQGPSIDGVARPTCNRLILHTWLNGVLIAAKTTAVIPLETVDLLLSCLLPHVLCTPRRAMPTNSTPFRLAVVNIKDGGIRHPLGMDHVLTELFATVKAPPTAVVVTEARDWDKNGTRLGLRATSVLADIFGPRYQIRIGHLERAPVPPAIIWNPDQLALIRWDVPSSTPNNSDVWNRAIFETAWWDSPLTVMAAHWHPWDRTNRLHSALTASGLLGPERFAILAGDFNCSPSGDSALWPFTDFTQMPIHQRHHKGWQPNGPSGPWAAHTAPLDHLLGTWDPATRARVGGIGWHTAVEVAWELRGRPTGLFPATVNDGIDLGGGMVIDHALLSPALAETVLPEETAVHLPRGAMVSDHRLLTTALQARSSLRT